MSIPRIIHRIWLGGPEPEYTARFAESWRREGWEVWSWTDDNVQPLAGLLANQDIYDRAAELAPEHVGQLRSDVLRYELLWTYGGVYVDADLMSLKPIDDLIADVECFAAWEVQDRWIANGFMGARRGHPFIRRLIDGLAFNVRIEHGHKPNRMTGPQYLTRMWQRYDRGDDVEVLPQRLIYPYGWQELEREHETFPDAYTAHWWHNKRRERGLLPAA